MLRFKNKDSQIPATPKAWHAPNGTKIAWNSAQQPWEAFVARVMAYCDANQIPRPALDWLEDYICHQMSGWACIDAAAYVARQSKPRVEAVRQGCAKCGKKKTV